MFPKQKHSLAMHVLESLSASAEQAYMSKLEVPEALEFDEQNDDAENVFAKCHNAAQLVLCVSPPPGFPGLCTQHQAERTHSILSVSTAAAISARGVPGVLPRLHLAGELESVLASPFQVEAGGGAQTAQRSASELNSYRGDRTNALLSAIKQCQQEGYDAAQACGFKGSLPHYTMQRNRNLHLHHSSLNNYGDDADTDPVLMPR